MTQYVMLNAENVVAGVFSCPQTGTPPTGMTYASIADSDPRYTAWQAFEAGAVAMRNALLNGLQIVSTSTPALNGTYAIDAATQQNISAVASGIASRNRVPGGGSTFNYFDMAGAPHAFSATNFLNFAAAAEDYIYALSQGTIGPQPVTIP